MSIGLADVCQHEGAHAAALMIGVPVKRVALDREGGLVAYHRHSDTRDRALRRMIVVLPEWRDAIASELARTGEVGEGRLAGLKALNA